MQCLSYDSIAVLAATIGVAAFMGKAQAKWIQASQERVARTSATISSIKWIKLSGLTESAFSIVHGLRVHELEMSRIFRVLLIWVVAFCTLPHGRRRSGLTDDVASMTPILSPVLTFITYTGLALKHDNALDISTAFTSLSLLTLLYKPLAIVIGALPLLASSAACFTRIQAYLNKPSWQERRICPSQSSHSKGSRILSASSLTSNQLGPLEVSEKDRDVIAVLGGKFRYKEDADYILDIADWKVQGLSFTLVLGPVGCGKSTALKGLLGELPDFEGSIAVTSREVGFCDQVPWLPNGTFREIVLEKSELDQIWYNNVISACALDEDLRQWPHGDLSVIGSKGTTLSGGQKQRTVSIYNLESFFSSTNRQQRLWQERFTRDANSSSLMMC